MTREVSSRQFITTFRILQVGSLNIGTVAWADILYGIYLSRHLPVHYYIWR